MAKTTIPAPDPDALAVVLTGYVIRYDEEAGTAEVDVDTDAANLDAAVAELPPLSAHIPAVDRLTALEARLDRAAAARVTGEAAKLRDNLKPTR